MKSAISISLLADEESELRSYMHSEGTGIRIKTNMVCISKIQLVQGNFWTCLTVMFCPQQFHRSLTAFHLP